MNRIELLKNHELLCFNARELMKRKNADYAGKKGDEPFANFTRCEAMGVCSTEQGFLVRMTDKMSRLSSFVDAGVFEVKDESLEDTIVDIINYAVLFQCYVQSKKSESKE